MKFQLILLTIIFFCISNISLLHAQQKKISHQTGIKAGIGFSGKVFMGEGTYHLNYHPIKKIWIGIETGITGNYWFRLRSNFKNKPIYSINLGVQLGYVLSKKHRLFSRLGYTFQALRGPMFQYGLGYSLKKEKSEFQFMLSRDWTHDLYRPKQITPYGDISYYAGYFSFSITYLKSFRFRF
jgi:hypothetical protein